MLTVKYNFSLKPAIFILVLIFSLGLTVHEGVAQDTLHAGVPTNFGIEGDIWADMLQFGGLGAGIGTDDWFDNNPGAGIGVIDTNGGGAYYQLIQDGGSATNKLFKKGMAFPKNTVQHGKLLFDAVYVRDFNSAAGLSDSSQFTAGADKNADNPNGWTPGTGNVPQKNDIVDAFAHLRYDGPTDTDSLWLLLGLSRRVVQGDAHYDWELFRTADTIPPGGTVFPYTGPDGGHTAWRVVGGNLQPGDLIFSVDYTGGGKFPTPSVRLWVHRDSMAAIEAANPVIVFTGVATFDGTDAGPFGYAEIDIPDGAAYARVNGIETDPFPRKTLAPPWKTLEGSAAVQDSFVALQMSETAFNLNAMGLGEALFEDPCEKLFGWIFFKTRASQSFTAELKDFVGPYPFGEIVQVELGLSKTDVLCYGGSDGTITATWSGGTGPYMIDINGGGFVAATSPHLFSGLAAGSYQVIVKDVDDCPDTTNITVNQPTEVVLSLTKTDALCYGACDGSITATFSGGTPGYMIEIDGGGFVSATSTHLFSDLCAGSYEVVVKDANDCPDTANITVNQPTEVVLSLTKTDALCYQDCDGTITATFSGGTPGYMIEIDGGGFVSATSTHLFSDLCAGSYQVVVKDDNDCPDTANITVSEPTEVVLSLTKTDALCYQDCDGSITATFSGGTPGYMIEIDGGGFVSATSTHLFSDLCAGSYEVVVKDANDCPDTANITVNQPTEVVLSLTKTDALCYQDCDGTITATFSGGTPGYMIEIDGGGFVSATSTHLFSDLCAGSYEVVVKDANDCPDTANITVSEPTEVVLSLTKTDALCYGACDGSITATFSGGTPGYMIEIDGGGFVSATSTHLFSDLCAGSYEVVVKDANDCPDTANITVDAPVAVELSLTKTDVLCYGDCDGTITATFSGGTAPYVIEIDGGGFVSATSTHLFSDLCAGSYEVVVKDDNDCVDTANITVNQPTEVVLSLTKTDALCYGACDGTITATFSGGTPGYMIEIDGGGFVSATSTHLFSDLCAGSYEVVVKDANDCPDTANITVNEPTEVVLSLTKTDALCYQSCDGTITATFSGGTPGYMIEIDGGGFVSATSTHLFSDLCAGSYEVVVKDANDCPDTANITVSEPTEVVLSLTKTDALCYGACDGTITATFSGGTPGYMIEIDGGGFVSATSTHLFSDLCAGSYEVVVKDANDCPDTANITVDAPVAVELSLTKTDVLCYGDCDGTITATFSGGTAPYMIEIDGGGFVSATSTHLFSDLCAGSYEVVVKDANDCADTANITVNQPTEVVLSLDSTDVLCYGACDGTITATFSGGTAPYMIEIDGGGFVSATSTHLFSDLCAGSHEVVVKDDHDCPDTANVTLTEPPELSCTVSPLDTLICAGDSAQFCVNPTGGTPPFTFSWDGPSGFTSADSCIYAHDDGAYSVLVTDANACTTRCEGTLTTEPCGDEFCSLTQGAYGNYGGKYFGMGTLPLIQSLLTPSPLVVGKPGRSLTIPLAAAGCIIQRLPASGTPVALPAILGDATLNSGTCQTSPTQLPLKNGRFWNVFLGQTITLSLNVRLGCDLGTFELCDSIETKAALFGPDGEPCTEDDIIDPGPDGIPDTPDDPPAVGVLIPPSVLTALSNLGLSNSVDDLLELANRALAGQPTGGASISQINMAVDNINNAFDECRFVTYCGPRISLVAMVKETGESSTLPEEFSLSQNYPNPFNPVCNIDYALATDCHVRLAVYNTLGQKVRVLVDEYQSAGHRSVTWDGKNSEGQELTTGVYFYRITAGDFAQSRKMVLIK